MKKWVVRVDQDWPSLHTSGRAKWPTFWSDAPHKPLFEVFLENVICKPATGL